MFKNNSRAGLSTIEFLFSVFFFILIMGAMFVVGSKDIAERDMVDLVVKNTYIEWVEKNTGEEKEAVEKYISCVHRSKSGGEMPRAKECLFLTKNDRFINTMINNINKLDVDDEKKVSVIGRENINKEI